MPVRVAFFFFKECKKKLSAVTKWEFLVVWEVFVQDMIGQIDFCGSSLLKLGLI